MPPGLVPGMSDQHWLAALLQVLAAHQALQQDASDPDFHFVLSFLSPKNSFYITADALQRVSEGTDWLSLPAKAMQTCISASGVCSTRF